MTLKFLWMNAAVACMLFGNLVGDAAQDKKRSGTVIGEIKAHKKTPGGKNVIIEVLAAGEEKARSYRVQYDPKVKGPIPAVLEAVQAAKVGDRVQLDWVDTGEGLAIKAFQVLKKASGDISSEVIARQFKTRRDITSAE